MDGRSSDRLKNHPWKKPFKGTKSHKKRRNGDHYSRRVAESVEFLEEKAYEREKYY